MTPNQDEQAKNVMSFIMELENKVRDKNKQIASLKEDVDNFQKLYVKAAFLQPWGATVTGGVVGGLVGIVGTVLYYHFFVGGM